MTKTPLRTIAVSAVVLASALATSALADSAGLTLTPAPAKAVRAEGAFQLSAATRIHVAKGDVEAKGVATQLADLIQRSRGFKPGVVEGAPAAGEPAIVLTREGPAGEAYKLDVSPTSVTIAAARRAGLIFGASVDDSAFADPGYVDLYRREIDRVMALGGWDSLAAINGQALNRRAGPAAAVS